MNWREKEDGVSESCRNLNFQLRQLDKHNEYRKAHGANPLVYDPELADLAQKYAEFLSENDLFEHDPELKRLKQGENLAW